MGLWLSIHDCVPWVRRDKPYFVHAGEEARLRADLRSAEFSVFTMEGVGLSDEGSLLEGLGKALRFPGYFGANWDAFADCAGDMANQRGPVALIWTDADAYLSRDLHGFTRAVHELLSVTRDLGSAEDPFQFEIFLVAAHDAFRNVPAVR